LRVKEESGNVSSHSIVSSFRDTTVTLAFVGVQAVLVMLDSGINLAFKHVAILLLEEGTSCGVHSRYNGQQGGDTATRREKADW
jgi:hypothetical protein